MTMILTLGLALTQALLLPAAPAPSPVTISIVTQTRSADVAYQTVIHNVAAAAAAVTITQQLPAGASKATATDGGAIDGTHIQWTKTVPSGGEVTLRSTATTPSSSAFSSVCATDQTGIALACATVGAPAASAPVQPLWRRLLLGAAGLLALGVLLWGAWRWWERRPKPQKRPRREWSPRERTLAAIGGATVGLLAALGLIALMLGPVVKSTMKEMTGGRGGGWSGTQQALTFGAPVSDQAVEFTMYQAQCGKGGCTVVIAARNTSGQDQQFYRSMQRLYTSADEWVSPDNANGFFQTFPAGTRTLVTLHFPLAAGAKATRLELREGAFARGVYYDLP
jgi:hypothetical protein